MCFLEQSGSAWREATVCTQFVLSLYSPTSTMIVSITCMLGSLFVLAALNQLHPDRAEEKRRVVK